MHFKEMSFLMLLTLRIRVESGVVDSLVSQKYVISISCERKVSIFLLEIIKSFILVCLSYKKDARKGLRYKSRYTYMYHGLKLFNHENNIRNTNFMWRMWYLIGISIIWKIRKIEHFPFQGTHNDLLQGQVWRLNRFS